MNTTDIQLNELSKENYQDVSLNTLRLINNKLPSFIFITYIGYLSKGTAPSQETKNECKDSLLIFCLEGKGYCTIDNSFYEIHSNDFMIIPASKKKLFYWADRDDPWTIYAIHFTGVKKDDFGLGINLNRLSMPRPIPSGSTTKIIELWQNIYEILISGHSKGNLYQANFCFYGILAILLFSHPQGQADFENEDYVVNKAIQMMTDHIDQKLTIEKIAREVNLSASHFAGFFKKATGSSPIDYFINLKMQKASQLLISDNYRVMDVASCFGYDDPYYFSRIFKKSIGVSPNQYRKQKIKQT